MCLSSACSDARSASISAVSCSNLWARSCAAASAFMRMATSSARCCCSATSRRWDSSCARRCASSAVLRCASASAFFLAACTSARRRSSSNSACFKASSSARRSFPATAAGSNARALDLGSSRGSTSPGLWLGCGPSLRKACLACARCSRLPLANAAISRSATMRWLDGSFASFVPPLPFRPQTQRST